MTQSSGTLTSHFIDLATYDAIERYLYGGEDSRALFVLDTRKATWFTIGTTTLMGTGNSLDFGRTSEVNITRAADYLLKAWLRVVTPRVTFVGNANIGGNKLQVNERLRWTRNLMHNIVEKVEITFNDLVAQQFTNFHLDFWSAFTVPKSKRSGYDLMIGNGPELTTPVASGGVLPSRALNLPLPLFFSRDSGVALPTAALPYNDMRIRITLRPWDLLLIHENTLGQSVAAGGDGAIHTPLADGFRYPRGSITTGAGGVIAESSLSLGAGSGVWALYATVSNAERKLMGCGARNIVIEQVQTVNPFAWVPSTSAVPFDLRFSHAIKCLFYSARNVTHPCEWSNYGTSSPVYDIATSASAPTAALVLYPDSRTFDPIENASLRYENQQRYSAIPSDITALVFPFYLAEVIPEEPGYHMFSYALCIESVQPSGSTNYGKLTNVTLDIMGSSAAIDAAAGVAIVGAGAAYAAGTTEADALARLVTGTAAAQRFEVVATAVNHNIVRVSGGALGFPVL